MNNIQLSEELIYKLMILEYKIGSIPLQCLLEFFNNNLMGIIEYLELNYPFVITNDDESFIKNHINYIKSKNITIIPFFSPHYPRRLKSLLNSPIIIFALGNINLLNNPLVSVVGTRNPTLETIEFTKYTATTLNHNGFTVLSGMANGVDTIAHESSLPNTIGIIPYGFNKLYENQSLLPIMMEKNALILSRFPFSHNVEKWHFLHRNSLIAAIGSTTCIMQCNLNSGTMDTATKAKYYNNNLYVVTAHPNDYNFKGNLSLLEQGAKPLINANSISYHYSINENKPKFLLNNCSITNDYSDLLNKSIHELIVNQDCNSHIILNRIIHYKLMNQINILGDIINCI